MEFTFDTSHTQVEFTVKHMMVTNVRGRFNTFDGTLTVDPQNPTASHVTFSVDAASVFTNDARRDGHLKSADFFDVANYPTITFESTKIEPQGGEKYRVTGNLTIRGVTRLETFEVTNEGAFKSMQGNQSYSFSLTGAINRKDFGLMWNVGLETGGVLVSDTVKIVVEGEVTAKTPATAQV